MILVIVNSIVHYVKGYQLMDLLTVLTETLCAHDKKEKEHYLH